MKRVKKVELVILVCVFLGLVGTSYASGKRGYKFCRQLGSKGSGEQQFDLPHYLDVGPQRNIYVADWMNVRIQKITVEDNDKFSSFGQDSLIKPCGIAVDSAEYVYVTDYGHNRVLKFDPNGEYVTEFPPPDSTDRPFAGPYAVALDSLGFVYVTDHGNHRVLKFTTNGEFEGWWGGCTHPDHAGSGHWHEGDTAIHQPQAGSGEGQFNKPTGITVDSHGSVYICDLGNHRVLKFTTNGEFEGWWGGCTHPDHAGSGHWHEGDTANHQPQAGSGEGQFNIPCGVGVDPAGHILVVESYNNRFQEFGPDGTFVGWFGACDNSDHSQDSGHWHESGSGHQSRDGDGNGQFFHPMDIAFDALGYVYVSDYGNNRVQVFAPIIETTIDIDPDTLNVKSHGRWITAYITLPEGYDVTEIDVETIAITQLEGQSCIPDYTQMADPNFIPQVGDRDEDGITDLTVKFNRQVLLESLCLDDIAIAIEGDLTTGLHFIGSDTIRVIERGK